MELQHPFRAVTPSVDGDVLAVLAGAEHDFTVSTLEQLIPHRSGQGIRLVLDRLVEQGTVVEARLGRSRGYRLNREHLAADAIIALASLRTRLIERLRAQIELWEQPPLHVVLFGSGATGAMQPDSDLDVLIVHDSDLDETMSAQVADLAERATRWTGNDARMIEFHSNEIAGTLDTAPLLADVLRDGIPIYGTLDALRRLVAPQ